MLIISAKRKYMDDAPNKLLIVYHSKSGTVKKMADAIVSGAKAIPGTTIELVDPLKVTPETVKTCQAIIIGTPENFGYMSGPIKYFFEEKNQKSVRFSAFLRFRNGNCRIFRKLFSKS